MVLIVAAYAYQGPIKKWQAGLGKPNNFLAKAQLSKMDKIEISREGKTATLEKQGDKWKVGGTKGFYVSKANTDEMMNALIEAQKSGLELVSANKMKKNDFETGDKGIKIKLFVSNKAAVDFTVGKPAGEAGGNYVSRDAVAETFLVKADLYRIFSRPDWRELTVFASDKDSIAKLRLQYPDREIIVEKKNGKWEMFKPRKEVKAEKLEQLLDIMSSLAAVKIPEQTFKGTGLEKHAIIVQATGEGVDNTIMIGDKSKEGLYYAKPGANDNIYLISKSNRDELDKKVNQF